MKCKHCGFEPASEETIAEIVKKWCANLDNDDRRSILVKALTGKVGELVGKEEVLKIVLDDVPHQYQKRLLEVLNVKR